MLCKSCSENNAFGRTNCVMCGAPLLDEIVEIQEKPKQPFIGRIVGIIASIYVFNSIAPHIFSSSGDSINFVRLISAAAFGAVGAVIGDFIEKKLSNRQSR